MNPVIKYPIGIQTFSKIREEGYLYVDKTALVYQLATGFDYVFLSRPRRFGKSLLLSTLQAYFEGRSDLFKGLAIEKLQTEYRKHPVLRFDLSGDPIFNPDDLTDKISAYLSEMEKEYGVDPENGIGERFRKVIKAAYEKTGQPVVVLIDEYDKPMLDTLHDSDLNNILKDRLSGFYSILKSCDPYLRFVMLTGVTKFAKVSVFSGLNNLRDISLNPKFNSICGITESEFHDNFLPSVKEFAATHSKSEDEVWRGFKEFYDGYHFAYPTEDVYNPFSTLNAFADGELQSYWFESASPSYLIKLIKRNQYVLGMLEGAVRSRSQLLDLSDPSRDIVPLLYQAGYLTIKGYDDLTESYILGFPNKEVSSGFWNSLVDYFFKPDTSGRNFSVQDFVRDLALGRIDDFMVRMQSLFAKLGSETESNKEIHFQNMLTIFVNMLGFKASTEIHSSQGRSDVEIKTPQFIYILELKVDSTPHDAMCQIWDKGYAVKYGSDPRRKILIGANFSSKTRTLTGWEIEEYTTPPSL